MQKKNGYALFLEMGLGKSKLALMRADHLFAKGWIGGLLIIAPNGVAPNWVFDEIPAHLDSRASVHLWQTKKAGTKTHANAWKDTLNGDGLLVLVMSYDAMMTEKGCAAAKSLLTYKPCLYVLDESTRIKTPGAKRTKRVLASGKHAPYRMVMTGTPVSNSPFDVFTQLKFIQPDVWDDLGCRRFESFKTYFGIWEEFQREDTGQRFKKLIRYRHLDELHDIVAKLGSRLLKEDVLDLPPKLYQKRFFELVPEQRKLYNTLRREFMILLDSGDMVTAALAITRMLRLQQITSGFLPIDSVQSPIKLECVEIRPNPRIACLKELVGDVQGSFIVWAKFQRDIDLISEMLAEEGVSHGKYDGRTSMDDREMVRNDFKMGHIRAFVANPSCAGEGLTLTAAKTVIYYNNSFKLADRLQSEDRAHRIGQEHPVTYIDICATNTIDGHIVAALREKLDYASIVTGDSAKNWI